MDSVIMTSPGNSTRIKSRLRNAAANFLARNSKNHRQFNNLKHNVINNNKNNRIINARVKHNGNLKHVNNYKCSGINGNHKSSSCVNKNVNNVPTADTTTTNANNLSNHLARQGSFAREVYNTIGDRLGHTSHIPGDSVQTLFNDMHLYPSKSQAFLVSVSEMLQCARQCGRRNGTTSFLTFGEFCVFAREMQRPKSHRRSPQKSPNANCARNCEVFLGGSCNPTTWRIETAIPELQKHGITYYNPQKSIWGPELVAEEHDAKQSASVLLFVLDSQTRSVAGMIEVAYLVASDRCVVVVAHPYQLGQSIMGEELSYRLTSREYDDLVSGQMTLLSLLRNQGVKVHSNLTSALQKTTSILKYSYNLAEEQVTSKLRKLREVFDSYNVDATGKLHLNDVLDAYYRLTNKTLQIAELYSYLSSSNIEASKMKISFEEFCSLVAEFSSDGCNTITDDWASQPVQRQCSTNNNTHCDMMTDHKTCNGLQDDRVLKGFVSDVYLGGSCSPQATWRETVAIPLLKKHGLTYYNPAIRETNADNEKDPTNGTYFNKEISLKLENWNKSIESSKVVLFVVTNDTRSLTTMILAAHYMGLSWPNLILCIQSLPTTCDGHEQLTTQAIKDYNRGRVYLSDLAKRKQIPVFENITEAVQRAISQCRGR
ncbi:uncharacterized protein LOC116163689 isoform X4 [Photinus pyralis]|uniref:uncharacterized protein LOC116163689 isoform X4 n=1 Tax=Photinus pyralis TaxID=7054 RepID=UPI0012675230|nr:uncharacterized protein LOC116163689 isoform X4 [Photinus pyralis]